MDREQLPPLRAGDCIPLKCRLAGNEFSFDAHFNFYPDGRLGELFAHSFRTGTDLGGLVDKFAISISLLLQHGVRIAEIWRVLDDGRTADQRDIFLGLIAGGVDAEQGYAPPVMATRPTSATIETIGD